MVAITQAVLHYYYRILTGWYRLSEGVADYLNLSRRLSGVMLLLALLLCWILTTAIVNEAWFLVGAVVALACFVPFITLFPEWSVVAVAFMLSSIVSPLLWDRLPLFSKGFALPYVLLMYATVVVFLQHVITLSPYLRRWISPVSLTLILFLFLVIPVGLFYHTVIAGYSASKQLVEMQHLVTWLIYFVLTGAITTERRLRAVQAGVLCVAALGSLATVLQGVFGEKALFFLKLGEKDIRLEYSEGMVRVLPPGMLFILAIVVGWQMTAASFGVKRLGWLLLTVLGIGAVILTQLRHLWGILLFGILIIWWYSESRTKIAMAVVTLLLATLLGSVVLLSRPVPSVSRDDFFARVQKRWNSIFYEESQQYSSSLGFRLLEISQMWEQWRQSPVFGIGWGKPYRVDQRYDPYLGSNTYTFNSYVHNSFWWALGKGGIVSAIALLALWVVGLWRGYQWQRRVTERAARAWLQALWICYVMFVLSAQFHPAFWINKNIVSIAIVLGLMEVIGDFALNRSTIKPDTIPSMQ
jgi:O-antigen ligase